MTNFYGKNLCYGDVINVEGDGKIALSNFHVENIYFKYENSLIKTHNPQKNGPNVSLSSCSIKNLYQNFEFYSASLITINQGIVKFDNCNIDNINGIKMGLTSQENQGIVHFISTVINNIYSKYPEPIFYSKNYYKYFSERSLLKIVFFFLFNKKLYNIHECYKTNSCNSFKEKFSETFDSSLLYHSSEIKITLNHCSFDHIYGKKGMKLNDGYISFKNSQIVNSYFENGFLYYPNNNNKEIEVSYNFENVTFSNNKSNKGTFLHISDVISGSKFLLDVRKSNFINNTAEYFGGVIYSEAKKDFSCYNLIFKNSIFEDNTAILGKISYVFDIEHEMLFFPTSLLDDLKSFNNNFVTNPTYLMFDEDYNNTIEIYSGDRIDQEYSSSIYDDYGNKFSLSDDISNSKIEDLIFYEMLFYGKKNEVLRSKIYGSTKSYCLNNSCKFKNLRLVGPPGDYVLELKIVGFGNYEEFLNNSIKLNVKIKECNEPGYIYQDKDGENIKSCYKPICNPKCSNQGVCINDNICDCSKTTYTGRICSERNRLGKNKIFNQIIYIISIGFIIVTIGSIYFVFHHRKNEIIKAGNI
ncbi:hypothetical protein BCR36DRAFT_275911 [Piromyces finnis]|uniref:EGF-like domain-containing protein n=1 Tax=Piromyces finnis TaxID=1754191 RepID=A0A1Y1VM47_9FUNG|nr:hypothetical protein BCR36DRAFT_275911 [Piromyces finnis]|eukprot:ORX59206.1 hypothetical protein BCR36DRAFT_275911 [Piromyces finnis]